MLSRPISVMFIEHHCSAHGPNLLNQVSGVALRSTGVSPRSRYMDRMFLVIQVDGVDFLVRNSFRGQKRTHILQSLLVDTIIHIPCNSGIISKSIHRSCKNHCNPCITKASKPLISGSSLSRLSRQFSHIVRPNATSCDSAKHERFSVPLERVDENSELEQTLEPRMMGWAGERSWIGGLGF